MQASKIIKGRVLYVSPEQVLLARGAWIFESRDSGASWRRLFRLPFDYRDRVPLVSSLLCRLLRKGIHHLEKGHSSSLIVSNKEIFLSKASIVTSREALHGSRPLLLCSVGDTYYYGEYRSNNELSPVHIWRWDVVAEKWAVAWQFTDVRHVHGVFFDVYSNSIWVTTGDRDSEVAIWRTDDGFESLQKVAGGAQQFRAVQLLFTDQYVYFGSDAPDKKNHIYRMDRNGENVECLAAVGSSVFYGCKVGSHLFFSTAVEPSQVNKSRYAEVWGSADGLNWKLECRFRKDLWSMRYFQYGQVSFPAGPGDGKTLWLAPMATEGDQKTFRYSLDSF